jgi:putative ABC transport system permease protein
MHLGENAQMAVNTLRENKMRSFLTVLGVVIGITALLSVVSILVGVYSDVNSFLSDYGPETLFIFRFDPGIHTGRLSPEERARKPLTLEDAEAIAQFCPHVKAVTASLIPRVVEVGNPPPMTTARYRGKEVAGLDYSGTLPATEEVFNSIPARGRFFTEAENMHRSDVALIGPDIAKALFPDEDPLGKTIEVGDASYLVIAVLTPRKGQLIKNQAADRTVMVPYRTYHKHNPNDDENLIGAVAYPGQMAEAEDEIRGLLRRRRNVPYDKKDSFGISSAKEIADQFRQITASVALLISVVSSIGLLVGGVGVMNIMLVSVTERTREIGVRKAIGATKRNILVQFTVEATTLCAIGGIIGIFLGAIITLLIHAIFSALPATMSTLWTIIGFTVSLGIGLVFGIYPAWKAATLDPIEALRYE